MCYSAAAPAVDTSTATVWTEMQSQLEPDLINCLIKIFLRRISISVCVCVLAE